MKSLKIFLVVLMMQIGMQVHADNDLLADIVKGVLGAKLLQGISQEISNNNGESQEYSSSNDNLGQHGSLGYQYYVIGQKHCKEGSRQQALKWFKESKQQGFLGSNVAEVLNRCLGVQLNTNRQRTDDSWNDNPYRKYKVSDCDGLNEKQKSRSNKEKTTSFECISGNDYYYGEVKLENGFAIPGEWKNKYNQGYSKGFVRHKHNGSHGEAGNNDIANAFNSNRSKSSQSFSSFKAKARYLGHGDDDITIKAPKVVENSEVVPVTAVFGNRVNTNDKIKLYVNGKLAFQANPRKGSYIDQISTRVRLKSKDNRIKVKVIRADGSIETKTSKTIYTDNPALIPSISDSSKKYKLREENGDIKMLVKNKMGNGKHIWKIKLTSSSGEVFVKLSPLLSKNPYLQIKGNHDNAKLTKALYGNCDKDYSNSTKEPTCLFENEEWYASLRQEIQAEEDQDRALAQEDILNELKVNYINQIAARVKENWRYHGAKNGWGCDVYILQDLNGKVEMVNLQSCNIDNNAKAKSFKNAIERAVYKASPLPHAPDKSVFDREVVFHLSVGDVDKTHKIVNNNNNKSFSDLWGQYGGSVLDSNTKKSSDDTQYSGNSDTRPPVIRLNHSDSIMISNNQVEISGVVNDSSKITELTIKGEKVTIDKNGNFNISRYIRLGRNAFDIVALDAFGNKATKLVTVTRKKDIAKNLDKPLELPSFTGRKDKNAVALIIGLDKYESIARAPWAESDASVFYDYAQQSLGIPADRIALITGDESDRSGIYDSLDMWLPTMVEKNNSNVYVYFAGHGLATADGEKAYLIPYDGNLENLRRTAIPRQEVISVLKNLKAKSVTLFMDTCYSGTPKGGKGTLVADARGLRIVKKDNFSSLPKNFTIFSAASNQQTASSHPNLENGLFSYWMMRGLGGEADNNNDRKITNGELHKFINKNVKKAAALMGRKQSSQLVGDANKVITSW